MNAPYNNYVFFEKTRCMQAPSDGAVREFSRAVKNANNTAVHPYYTAGFKDGINFMLWMRSSDTAAIQNALGTFLRTELGRRLIVAKTLFGIERDSIYVSRRAPQDQAIDADDRKPYLIIYPFTKTPEWYFLPMERRKKLMGEHILTGRKHPKIRQLLLYSFGVDDYEFIVSYEAEKLEEFQTLVMDLRESGARKYTKNDLPIYACAYRPIDEILKLL